MKKKIVVGVLIATFLTFNAGDVVTENITEKPIVSKQFDFRAKLISDYQKKILKFEQNQRKIFRQTSNIQAFARQEIKKYGWGMDQYACLYRLWKKESNWRWNAHNKSSDAYGIAQATPGWKMRHEWAGGGKNWKTDARTQVTWGLSYIKRNHGSPCVAWKHSTIDNWY
jgi:hypothetical protein